MLDDRYAQVTPEGKYVKPPRKEMSYGALIGTRAQLVRAPTPHHCPRSSTSLDCPRIACARKRSLSLIRLPLFFCPP